MTEDVFDNQVVVHLGDAPLPPFDSRWAYGDLHYHSQGTDNEGESGYAHRPTLHAASAIGLGFLLASEHASFSGQLDGISQAPELLFKTLRDMSPGRFRYAWSNPVWALGRRPAADPGDGGYPTIKK